MTWYKSISEFRDEKNQLFVFGPHQYALYFWCKAYENQKIGLNSLLVHVDLHSDFEESMIEDNSVCLTSEISKEYIEAGQIRYDTFIKTALDGGLINEVVFCCNPDQTGNKCDEFLNLETPLNLIEILDRFTSNQRIKPKEEIICRRTLSEGIILDIDLDYFLEFEPSEGGFLSETLPKKADVIKHEVAAINKLADYALIITVATSPEIFCGKDREEYFEEIAAAFKESFKLPIDFDHVKAQEVRFV